MKEKRKNKKNRQWEGGRKLKEGSKEKRRKDVRMERKEKRKEGKEAHFICLYNYVSTICFNLI